MKKFNEFSKEVETRELKTTNSGNISQIPQRELRKDITNAIAEQFEDFTIGQIDKGVVMELPHEELGAIPIVVSVVMKNPQTFNADHEIKCYQEHLQEVLERKEKRKAQARAKFESDKKLREKIKLEKELAKVNEELDLA